MVLETGEQLGILSRDEALRIAKDRGLDLVLVAPNANPPVCKIMDYGKYKYLQNKKAQEAKKKQKQIEVKEMKLRPTTEEHDFNFKVKNMIKFLQKGNKVRVNIFLRGREIQNPQLAYNMIEKLKEALKDYGALENVPKLEGRVVHAIFGPKS